MTAHYSLSFPQRLQELLSEEAKNLRSSLPIIKHGRLVKIAKDAELDLDEEELQQVWSIR